MINSEIKGNAGSEEVFNAFEEAVGQVEYQKNFNNEDSELMIATGSKYFMRTNDHVGFCIVYNYDGETSKIVFGRVGGGYGPLNTTYGAGDKVEKKIGNNLRALSNNLGKDLSIIEGD